MKALRSALVAGFLSSALFCPRAAAQADGAATHSYLLLVGQVRSQMNFDNKETIPGLVRTLDSVALDNQALAIGVLTHSLAGFPVEGVDPGARQFARNFDAILGAYSAVCMDCAELGREVAREDKDSIDSIPRIPRIRQALKSPLADTIGAARELIGAMERLGPEANTSGFSTAPIVKKLQADVEKLVACKEAHHQFTLKLRAELAQRFAGQDWSAKEILP
jgi:hypothetical protein